MATTATPKKKKTVKDVVDSVMIAGGNFLNDPSGKNRKAQEQALTPLTPQVPQVPQAQPAPEVKQQPGVIRSQETGKITGVTLPDGTTFLGVPEQQIQSILNRNPSPQGGQEASTARKEDERQQAIQQSLTQAQELQQPQVQGASPDIGQALGAGAVGAVPGIIGGAITGAVAGGTAGTVLGVPGIAAGAIGGAVTGFLIAMRNNLANQQSDAYAVDATALAKGDRYIRSLITDTNRNPQNAAQNTIMFYQTLNMIDAAHQKTWLDSQENLNKFLGKDGSRELGRFEVFDKTVRPLYLQQFSTALAAPNPGVNLITSEDMIEEPQ